MGGLWGAWSGAVPHKPSALLVVIRGWRYVRTGVEGRALGIVQRVTARVVSGSRDPVGDLCDCQWEIERSLEGEARTWAWARPANNACVSHSMMTFGWLGTAEREAQATTQQ